jgi:hypothetical protein
MGWAGISTWARHENKEKLVIRLLLGRRPNGVGWLLEKTKRGAGGWCLGGTVCTVRSEKKRKETRRKTVRWAGLGNLAGWVCC